ncbi:MAG: polysaccharide lyase family protein [Limisphaerales bacterium]
MLFLLAAGALVSPAWASEAARVRFWQIGEANHDDREFALAPDRYQEFRTDGFFVVGQSDPKRDWPYVHPGPADGWAGGREHTFSIVFGVKQPVAGGECRLQVDFLDTHSTAPPRLRIAVNGTVIRATTDRETFRLPAGAGDASVSGDPAKGREHQCQLVFPANLLKAGANEITLTTVSGSWALYDCLALEVPAGIEPAAVAGTVVGSMRSPPVLVERNGRLMQTVQFDVRHFGEPTEATVKIEGAADAKLSLRNGAQTCEVTVPAVEQATRREVVVAINGEPVARQALTLKPVRKWVVYLLPHSHVDIGYTHVQTDVERLQWRNFELAIETARRTANHPAGSRFRWNVEVLWAVDSYLTKAPPDKQQAFIDAVRAGQVGLEALYGNELTGLCRPEELLRLLGCARRLSERCGVPIESAMITDVPGYTWGMVSALAHSGVKYWSMGPNGGDRIGHTIAAWGDKPFWWIGPNGRDRVLVWMTGMGYYQVFQSPQKLMDYLARLDEQGYPYDAVQVRHCLGDNGAPDVNFADKVKAWNDTYAYPRLVIATADEMFHDFEKRYGDRLPKVRGDFTPYWEDGAASSARETALNRTAADRLTQAETLFAVLNPKSYPAEEFYQAWRNVVLYDEHTWGAHNSISEPDAPFVKNQWAIKQAFALEADRQSRRLVETALAGRGPAIERTAANHHVDTIDVFNTTSWAADHRLVVVPRELSQAGDAVAATLANPVKLTSQRLASGELVVLPASSIEPFSARRFYVTDGAPGGLEKAGARAEGTTLTTRELTLRVDEKTGAIVSLRSPAGGGELVDTHAPTALNDYFYLPGSDVKNLQRNGPVKISVREPGPLVASLLIESDAPGCRKLTREIRIFADAPCVEIINMVDKQAIRAKEGVHFGFAFNVPSGVMRLDVPWGVVRPEIDQIPGACKNWFTVQRWVDISNDKYGVTWATPDAPLVEIGGITANLIGSLPDPRAWLDHLEPSQTIYSWAMNNHWHTNYRAEQEGPTVFRYWLWVHRGGADSTERAARFATAVSQPYIVTPARGGPQGSKQELARSGLIGVAPDDVLVTAFKPSEDGKAWIVRLFGASGKTRQAKLRWRNPQPRAVWLSDNSERARQPVNGSVEVPGYGIVTVRADRPD